jgi:hypothetical protein
MTASLIVGWLLPTHCCPWRKMEAVIDATLREYQSSRSVFNFGFSAWRAGVQRLLSLVGLKY